MNRGIGGGDNGDTSTSPLLPRYVTRRSLDRRRRARSSGREGEGRDGSKAASSTMMTRIQEIISMPLVEALGTGALTLVAALVSRPDMSQSITRKSSPSYLPISSCSIDIHTHTLHTQH